MPRIKPVIKYAFTALPWQYSGQGAWIFVSLPQKMAKEIRQHFKREEKGWGQLKVTALTGETEWRTSIWFDTKANTYILPLKAEVRKKGKIAAGKKLKVQIRV